MARSRRNLATLPRIGAKLRNYTPTDPHHDVFALGNVADFAPSILVPKPVRRTAPDHDVFYGSSYLEGRSPVTAG